MSNFLEYKSYIGSIEFSEEDNVFFGQVLGIKGLLSYEGHDASELLEDFKETVDEYLCGCKELGIEPQKPVKDLALIEKMH